MCSPARGWADGAARRVLSGQVSRHRAAAGEGTEENTERVWGPARLFTKESAGPSPRKCMSRQGKIPIVSQRRP